MNIDARISAYKALKAAVLDGEVPFTVSRLGGTQALILIAAGLLKDRFATASDPTAAAVAWIEAQERLAEEEAEL